MIKDLPTDEDDDSSNEDDDDDEEETALEGLGYFNATFFRFSDTLMFCVCIRLHDSIGCG